jgi:protein-tyrosine-phosphatase
MATSGSRSDPPFNVLFLCTGNSARSIMAEALANHAAVGGGKFRAFSAGSRPRGVVDPLALELLQRHHIPVDANVRSKSWDEFAAEGAPPLQFVITVCDQARGEQCPMWPGQPMTAHWGVPDPAVAVGSDEERRRAFRDAFYVLRRRIELFASLPIDKLSRLALQQQLNAIGRDDAPLQDRYPEEEREPRTFS